MGFTARSVAVAILMGVVTASCSTGQGDPGASPTITLRFAGIEGPDFFATDPGPKAFLEALVQVSGGRITADIAHSYGNGATEAEADLIEAVASGDLDGAWPSARAFATAGISGLEVLEAPLTIRSSEAAIEVAADPVSAQVLSRVDSSGLKGIAVVPGGPSASVRGRPAATGGRGLEGDSLPIVQLADRDGDHQGSGRGPGLRRRLVAR